MFKSSFAKYLTTFIVIILVSFLTLSGIITSMIQSFVTNELEVKLESTGTLLVQSVEKRNIISVSRDIGQIVPVVEPLPNFDKKFEVIVTDSDHVILSAIVAETISNRLDDTASDEDEDIAEDED